MIPLRWVNRVDLNCDLGEIETEVGLAHDAAIIPMITSASVACGEHAGSPERMRAVARLCRIHDVAFGAHPGYADREHFGRQVVSMNRIELFELLVRQIRLASVIAAEEGLNLAHVKPHGALYNLAADHDETAEVLINAIVAVDRALLLFAFSGSRLATLAEASGIRVVSEAFADRNYDASGQLVSRGRPDAVLLDSSIIARRAVSMLRDQCIASVEGAVIPLKVDTICVHGDTPQAAGIVAVLRSELVQNRIRVARPLEHSGE
ncbi:MAG: 5-oxoprolinase subunit PxpA [Planctomycetota bacterium]